EHVERTLGCGGANLATHAHRQDVFASWLSVLSRIDGRFTFDPLLQLGHILPHPASGFRDRDPNLRRKHGAVAETLGRVALLSFVGRVVPARELIAKAMLARLHPLH